MDYSLMFDFLKESEKKIVNFFNTSDVTKFYNPKHINSSIFSYIMRPAKRLRPSVLLMACGSLGGDERVDVAVPAAAGVELFHTWTLVHDDLIDNDSLRRGEPTVHEAMTETATNDMKLENGLARDYGRDLAVLTGDIQHGWSVSAFVDCALHNNVNPVLILKLVKHLQSYVLGNLIHGEVLDVQYGMQKGSDMSGIDEDSIINMLWLKTGALYEFAGMAGALIGKNTDDFNDEQVVAIKTFTSNCGTAFQLQDDILGIVGDAKALGKPVGSDIREGKKTIIVYESLKNANDSQRETILSTLGNPDASSSDISEVTSLFNSLGGIDKTRDMARNYLHNALPNLDKIGDSRYKNLLQIWADYMINREF